MALYESDLEEAMIEHLQRLGYAWHYGPDIAPEQPAAERASYADVVLHQRLIGTLQRLNPTLSEDNLEDVLRRVLYPDNPGLIASNQSFHTFLIEGVPVEYLDPDGHIMTDFARLVDWNDPWANDWLVVNQFTVAETGKPTRRPDLVLFLNGLPLAVFELKNPADPHATTDDAFQQLQTYKTEYPALFTTNALLVTSDGLVTRFGSLTANIEWFLPWKTLDGEAIAPAALPEYAVMLDGLFPPATLLDYVHGYIVFENDQGDVAKKLAGYHQYHAVKKAVTATVEAVSPDGDRRIGVVWHTQGSGKSLTMVFYARQIIQHPALANPTLVVITDRNDLDDQLFGVFARCQKLFRQTPVQADNRLHLRALLQVASGGIIFTTMQKFLPESQEDHHPLLSDRHNIVVMADEAHRSQYDFQDGLAHFMRQALPAASFIGFTGTPVDLTDRSTRNVFGEYLSIYDMQQAVDDHATVPIYYEARLAKLELLDSERPHLDEDFEEVTEGEEIENKERLKTKWAALEALVGTDKRTQQIARDIVQHFTERQAVLPGKGMIVTMSRRIAVGLYAALSQLRPDWVSGDDHTGMLKVVMTGSAKDPQSWQQHIRTKLARRAIEKRFKDPEDSLQLVIVRDMWLTGFDVPPLHTMYLDKPMKGHSLMQAIARVNRVFRDKPGGLVVDYLGLAHELQKALATYVQSGGRGPTAVNQEAALAVMNEKLEILRDLFYGFDATPFYTGTPAVRIAILPVAQEHILQQEEGKQRFLDTTSALTQAFALAVPLDDALAAREEVLFYQAVRAALIKTTQGKHRPRSAIEQALQQLLSGAVTSDQVEDVFTLAGLDKPDISILSDQFLAEVRQLPYRNLAAELLQKLLRDEIKVQARHNLIQARSFQELLDKAIVSYHNRAIEAAQLIEILLELAKNMQKARQRGEELGLSEAELAFYDALEVNDSAVKILGDQTLRAIARELVETVRRNTAIDWTVRESAKTKLRVMVKHVLRRYGYPPDKQEQATQTVVLQAEMMAGNEEINE